MSYILAAQGTPYLVGAGIYDPTAKVEVLDKLSGGYPPLSQAADAGPATDWRRAIARSVEPSKIACHDIVAGSGSLESRKWLNRATFDRSHKITFATFDVSG